MPGPLYPSGRPSTGIVAPPKPVVKPWVRTPELPNVPLAGIPPEPLAAWRGLWHAIGQNLPYYINRSRATRSAMRKLLSTHG